MFKKATSQSEAAVKANFIVAAEIAKSSWPFSEGEFVKNCMLKVCDLVCPEKKQHFSNVSLSRNTVADRTCGLATNPYDQLMEKAKHFVAFSLAVDESCGLKSMCDGGTFGIKIDAWHNHRSGNL